MDIVIYLQVLISRFLWFRRKGIYIYLVLHKAYIAHLYLKVGFLTRYCLDMIFDS